jgi:uncharacterized protein (TIGR04551 family)
MQKGLLAVFAIAGASAFASSASAQAAPPAPPAPGAGATKPTPPPAAQPPAAQPPAAPPPAGLKKPGPTPAHAPTPAPAPAPEPEAQPPAGSESETPAAPAQAPATQKPALAPFALFPEQEHPAAGATPAAPPVPKSEDEVFAEDWWSHARPVFEIHGYFRTRAELFHNFSLGRLDDPASATWAQPTDNTFTSTTGNTYGPILCTPAESGGPSTQDNPSQVLTGCRDKTQAGANMRFRLDPELHISDNLRVVSQIDIFDNLVLGSTPSGYAFQPAATGGGYQVRQPNGYYANGVNADSTEPPTAGVNSLRNSIVVKRAWAEYTTPVGEVRFGRMPDHFGLGMVHNSGDGFDDDYQSTIDRLQFISAIKPLDLYVGGSWDFPNEGPISDPAFPGGQPYDLAQLDDVNQWSLVVMRKQAPELVNHVLSRGDIVLNGGAYVTYRKQLLANDQSAPTNGTAAMGANVPDTTSPTSTGDSRRNANIWTPDLWFQLRYKKFRFELEGASVLGSIDSDSTTPGGAAPAAFLSSGRKIREYGLATQLEQRLVEDKLRLQFDFGWASGDSSAFNATTTNNLIPTPGQTPANGATISTFRFNPAYRIDLILNRNYLQRIQGTYYFKPSVEYDFMRKPSGQRLGGGAGVIWTRASEFVQTPGHARDLGIELDGRLYFQSKDGSLNDKPGKMGGFFTMLEYGVLFPLAGLGYQEVEKSKGAPDTSAAQILRLYLGVLF